MRLPAIQPAPSAPPSVVADVERRIIRRCFAPRVRMSVLQWADERRMLSPEANAIAVDAGGPVPYDSGVTPYHREPMLALSDPRTEFTVLMFPSQDGKTEILNNFVGQRIDVEPGPMLVLQPTVTLAVAWSKDRLSPMLRDTPALRGKVQDARSRDSNNTIMHKRFPGGHLTITGSNSAAGLSARPIRDVLVDEVDRCAKSAGTEGDPIQLAFRRTTTFRRSKKLLISSPTIKGESRIYAEYLLGTQEEWHVPCPHCRTFQFLRFGGKDTPFGIKWDSSDAAPYYLCEHCHAVVEESWKPWMNARGQWIAKNPSAGPRVRSFWKNAWTAAQSSWRKLRDEWLKVQTHVLEMQAFINTVNTELWDPDGGMKLDADDLFARLEQYAAEVPGDVALIVRTTDVQDDRLETTVWGFGAGEEMWLIDFEMLPGNPSLDDTDPESPWKAHDEQLERGYQHESGATLHPVTTFIDSGGHATSDVYKYCKRRQGRGVFAIKGHNIESAPLLSKPTRNNNQRAILYMVGSSTAKDTIQRRLARIRKPGPGYIHLPAAPWMDRARVEQLTNEKRVPRIVDGFVRRVWVRVGPNELFDCAGYALAALQKQGVRVIQSLGETAAKLRAAAHPKTPDDDDQPLSAPVAPGPRVPRGPIRRRGSWITRGV